MNITNLDLAEGYWRTNSDSLDILKCLSEDHCVGGSDVNSQCKEGHGGALCAVCQQGYASTGNGPTLKCMKCEGGSEGMRVAKNKPRNCVGKRQLTKHRLL